MEFTPLFPNSFAQKPLSNIRRDDNFNTSGLAIVRAQFSISTWLLLGASVQSVVILLSVLFHVPVIYTILPSLVLILLKGGNVLLEFFELKENPLRKGVILGRHAALLPSEKGGFVRTNGESVGGGGMVVFLLGARCNSPLGIFSPTFATLGKHFDAMFQELESHPEEYAYLGGSNYANTSDRPTSPELVSVLYFKNIEGLHAFARGKVHMEGWDWFVKEEAKMEKLEKEGKPALGGIRDIGISHETYVVPDGGFENIYHNYTPSNFAATTHLVEEEGGVKTWVCPVVDANKNRYFKSSAARLGTVKGAK